MPQLCVLPGDGIGKEVIPAAVDVLHAVVPGLQTYEAEAGWECFLKHGTSVPQETLTRIQDCGAALFGAVSSPSHKVEGYRSAIISMRQALELYANIRPVRSLPIVSPRPDIDMIVVRENTEGLYSGREHMEGETAIAERVITRHASRRIAARALSLARSQGRKRLTIVHKANILPLTDGLFRDTVRQVADEFSGQGFDIEVDELLVDVAALKMVGEPERYDVVVTTNLFGDILSDAASHWCGGLGLAPSLNWGENTSVAEPVHGSAPDIAGQGIANPIAAILSGAMLVRYIWEMPHAADTIDNAVVTILSEGIGVTGNQLSTSEITHAILKHL
jgi:homoisocitrate dehydrogenase